MCPSSVELVKHIPVLAVAEGNPKASPHCGLGEGRIVTVIAT
jgi:hypothetical protein